MSQRVQRIMVQPIGLIFKHLQTKQRVAVWLYEMRDIWLEGIILGFDEFMNLVMDQAELVHFKKNTREVLSRKIVGRMMLKGDNITMIQKVQ